MVRHKIQEESHKVEIVTVDRKDFVRRLDHERLALGDRVVADQHALGVFEGMDLRVCRLHLNSATWRNNGK